MKRAFKKAFSLLLSICLLAGLVPALPSMAEEPASGDWEVVSPFEGAVTYENGWTMNPSDDSAYSYTQGSKAKLVFTGTGIRYVSQYDTNFGTVIIRLDDEVVEVNANGRMQRNVTLFERTGLENKEHVITVEAKDKGVLNRSGCVDITRFEVQHAPIIEEPEIPWTEVSPFGEYVTYEDGWTMNPSDDSAYSYTKGSKATLVFEGTAVRYISQYDVNFGTVVITLDNEVVEVNAKGAAKRDVTLFERENLQNTRHTITIEAKENGVLNRSGCVDITRFEIKGTPVVEEEEVYVPTEEWVPVSAFGKDVSYVGSWTIDPNDGSYGAAYTYSQASEASLTFYGTGIRWIGQYDTNFGTAIVTLDGQEVEVNIREKTGGRVAQGQILFEATGLAAGVHRISIHPKENGSGNRGCVDLSGFEVYYDTSLAIPVSAIEADSEIIVREGKSKEITAKVAPFNANKTDIAWKSLDAAVATVEGNVVTGVKKGNTKISATVGGQTAEVNVTVKEAFVGKRIEVSNEHPLLIVPVYADEYSAEGSKLSWGNSIVGLWNNVPEDIRPYTLLELHLGSVGMRGSRDHNDAMRFYEQQLDIAEANNIPVGVVVGTAGNVSAYTAAHVLTASWANEMLEKYDMLKALIITENYWTNYQNVANAAATYLPVAAENGAYVIWSEHKSPVIENVLNNGNFKPALAEYGDSMIFTWKNTPRVDNGETASYMQGLWLNGNIAQWGGLSDTWVWYEKRFWKVFEGTTSYAPGGEECRAVVSEPEALLGIQMMTIYNNGGCVYNFEHPAYVYASRNVATPVFKNEIVEVFRYAIQNPAPSKEEILAKTKKVVHGNLSSINLHSGLNMNDESLFTYDTGRYGLIPAIPASTVATNTIAEKVLPISEINTDAKRIAKFNELYPETYTGTAYAEEIGDTWVLYNSKVNENVSQNATVNVKGTTVKVDMEPHTFTFMKKTAAGIEIYLNNYRANKDSIWENYRAADNRTWNSDVDTKMDDWVEKVYSVNPDDDELRDTVYTIEGLDKEPTIEITRGLADQYGEIKVAYNKATGTCTITVPCNGYVNFTVK